MAGKALEVQSLTKKIKNKLIVDDVSFSVEKGEIFGLLGPNGAGKTTIIRMIVSLIGRTKGNVIINGYNLDSQFKESMSEMGAIVENPEFYKYLSGYKNLKHYANMAKEKITEDQIKEVVRVAGLEDAIHQKVKTYSLGMRQRLGVAQALLHSPSLLILDEPTNGLDPQGIREFRDYLRTLAKEGISVLVSSHLLSEMELMCDRFAIIERGKLIHISAINQLNDKADQSMTVSFEVSDLELAMKVLREQSIGSELKTISTDLFTINLDREGIATANQLLVKNQISVYAISPVATSLEDRFLELTGKEKQEVQSRVVAN
ncbi:bacitracin ABC transporter ATP-binding protein [Bacillus sp. FJAT-18017]|uniref:ABC transporter ATP-binding protein n=1 Tax=Bacillus sp. FJAT-18017 TaxID=1705566 RepID=UPI0006ADC282|nr:ABC transporter ATP-binding protein [Bacillus sp. FJAT-18017]ALC90554.1 bacitracin ABC transporter ATP-binding protein [Bacillus sp. FJAT-18017]